MTLFVLVLISFSGFGQPPTTTISPPMTELSCKSNADWVRQASPNYVVVECRDTGVIVPKLNAP